ncbi:MAG: hypothetical protein R2823_08620 [Acidimicrobiia bacterium]
MTSRAVPYARRRAARRAATPSARGPRIVPLALFVVAVMVVFFLMIYLRIALDRTAFELDTVRDQIATAESRQLDLRLELAQLQDPLRIANEATRMGLTYPDQRLTLFVDSTTIGEASIAPPVVEPLTRALEGDRP